MDMDMVVLKVHAVHQASEVGKVLKVSQAPVQ